MSTLPWDGSYLGSFKKTCVLETRDFKPHKMYKLSLKPEGREEMVFWCVMHGVCSNSIYGCVVDEIKPLFGLPKIGTHWLRLEGAKRIAYNIQSDPVTLHDMKRSDLDERTLESIKMVFIFRWVTGMTSNATTSVLMTGSGPTSYTGIVDFKKWEDAMISKSLYQKWIREDMSDVYRRHVTEECIEIKWAAQDVISRIDKELLGVDSLIYERASRLEP